MELREIAALAGIVAATVACEAYCIWRLAHAETLRRQVAWFLGMCGSVAGSFGAAKFAWAYWWGV